jgi:hypothetical protein
MLLVGGDERTDGLDLYFEEDKLIVINFGVFIDDDLEVNWPQ